MSFSFSIYVGAFSAAVLFIFVIRKLALHFDVVPQQSFRRPDQQRVPLLGGLGIYLAVFSANLILWDPIVWNILISAFPLAVFGTLDDCFDLRARNKLISQALCVLTWISLNSPQAMIFCRMDLPLPVGIAITAIILIGLANAFNFLDGVDGQVGTLGICCFAALALAAPNLETQGFLLAFATLGFLYYNFPPAQIYLGEVGSSFLGFSAGALFTLAPIRERAWISFIGMCFLFGLPLFDMMVAVVRRLGKGVAPWAPDRDHYHHKLQKIGLKPKQVFFVSTFTIVCSTAMGGLLLTSVDAKTAFVAGTITASLLVFVYLATAAVEHIVATRVSIFGRSLIEKYFRLDRGLRPVSSQAKVVMFDFLPYYADLQLKGIQKTESFVKRIWTIIDSLPNKQTVRLVGSYTIAVVLNEQSHFGELEKKRISQEFALALLEYQVMKNEKKNPEGLVYFDEITFEIQQLLSDHIYIDDSQALAG